MWKEVIMMERMERLLNAGEVASMLGIGKLSVYSLVARKQIPYVKISRRILRFRESEIAEWIDSKARNCRGGR
jgi:excisionase family DNA binding protein